MRELFTAVLITTLTTTTWAEVPSIYLDLGDRHAHATPSHDGRGRTGGGNITVTKPTLDVVTITMSGAVIAPGHPLKDSRATMTFDLKQKFKIVVANPNKVTSPKLEVQAQIIGLLRSGDKAKNQHKIGGFAEQGEACASILCGPQPVTSICIPAHTVGCREKQSINCQQGPVTIPITPGCYELCGKFTIQASRKQSLLPCRSASAEFARGAIDPALLGQRDSFRGASKDNYGFRITVRVMPE